MGRLARVVLAGIPHHVTQRGNRREDVFRSDADRRAYLALLEKYQRRHGLEILAYCLMSNHVHFAIVPRLAEALGRTFRDLHTAYAGAWNVAHGISGHLWQGRFFSCPLDDVHLWAAVRYVERNPVRAGLVGRAEDYPWSSAPAHCGLRQDGLLAQNFPPAGAVADWRTWLETEDQQQTAAVRRQTRTGRPCGDEGFVKRLEGALARVLRPQQPGPKRQARPVDGKGLFDG